MKNVLPVALAVLISLFGGYYFVVRPLQESGARTYCGGHGKQAVDGLLGYHDPSYQSDVYDLAYRTCLNQRGF